ncbi:hypothetical protein BC834DRAFT_53220 [Gloeopeniophorella convolvens]|nr:hypothetical protein BC834DRAFT_53220 [Gloeopeniophorella convolvens]
MAVAYYKQVIKPQLPGWFSTWSLLVILLRHVASFGALSPWDVSFNTGVHLQLRSSPEQENLSGPAPSSGSETQAPAQAPAEEEADSSYASAASNTPVRKDNASLDAPRHDYEETESTFLESLASSFRSLERRPSHSRLSSYSDVGVRGQMA